MIPDRYHESQRNFFLLTYIEKAKMTVLYDSEHTKMICDIRW